MSLLIGLLGKVGLKSSFLWQGGQWLVKAFSTLNLQHTKWLNIKLNTIMCYILSIHKTAVGGIPEYLVSNLKVSLLRFCNPSCVDQL